MAKVPLLCTESLSIGYSEKIIIKNQNLSIFPGDLICLMGPNGSGKSTLLRTLVGLQKVITGVVRIDGKDISKTPTKELSHLVSVVLTERTNIEGLTVEDVVRLGRFPHTNMWGKLESKDRNIIFQSLELLQLEEIKNKLASEISDGQLQKVFIARALAQDTPLIVLDEPTTFLDMPNKMELICLLKRIAKEKNKALLFSSHDWDLALEMCPKAWLIESKEQIKVGTPEEFLFHGSIQKLYMNEKFFLNSKNGRFCELRKLDNSIQFECDDMVTKAWIEHALEKLGYSTIEEDNLKLSYKNNLYKINGQEFVNLSAVIDHLKLG